ncbi:MAG: hypothetical protein IPM66_22280 [Acidobacteriota bacterium]|nr:MAG: hypothetical protein IPM66_22280 [Acidobacteriota bacterium]
MPNSNNKQLLRPAIVIGAGGTGNQVVRRLKSMIRQNYGDTPTLLHFMVLDTDAATFNDRHWSPLPELTPLEKLPLYDQQVPFADVRENAGAYPEIHEWLPPTVDVGLLDRQEGSGQIRMLGRMAFYKSFGSFERRLDYLFTQCQRIQKQLEAMKRYEFDVAADPVIYIVSSVCGGQGAGVVIDLAVALREMARNRFPSLNLIGALALPSVFADRIPRENRSKTLANAHAAMKEIDYLMHSADKSRMRFRFPSPLERVVVQNAPLFDICYLIDNRHGKGSLSSAEEVFDQIATQFFLEIGTPFGARSESIRVNLNSVTGIERDKVYNTGRRYSGFGNHTITFDRDKIVEWAGLKSTRSLIDETLLGVSPPVDEIARAVDRFLDEHNLTESQELFDSLCSSREVAQEQVTAAYALDRNNHDELADDLWARLDAFRLRRADELRSRIDGRARLTLDGTEGRPGIQPATAEMIDQSIRRRGINAALDLADAAIDRLQALAESMRADAHNNHELSREHHDHAELLRDELIEIAQEQLRIRQSGEDVSLLTRIWRAVLAFFGGENLNGYDLDDDEIARELEALDLRAEEQRNLYLDHFNRSISHRLAAETREAAARMASEILACLKDHAERLSGISDRLTEAAEHLNEELTQLSENLDKSRYIGGATMRRDVTADYVEQYLQMRGARATAMVREYLLPEGENAITAIENRLDPEQLRERFADHYANDILRRADRDSLAEMIERLHSNQTDGSLTSRIGEGLQFCLPFWDIRVPGNQFATEVLMVGLEQEYTSVRDYLEAHAITQPGQVYAQIVPTAQDSVILISRIAHGASYYWHAQDENYYREYTHALTSGNFFLHLRNEWRTLPEPIPEPHKFQRRVFILGLAYELIAVRGSAYYLDPQRRYSLVGTTRHNTADWLTIPLLSAVQPQDPSPLPVTPDKKDLIGDRSRWETMQTFVEDECLVAAVREKLLEMFNQIGREAMREGLEKYCRDVLEPAIGELEEGELGRIQLEIEVAELEDLTDDLEKVTGMLRLRTNV